MRVHFIPQLLWVFLLSLLLTACGRGVSPTTPLEPEEAATISVFGIDGPMAAADIAVYHLQDYLTDSDTDDNLLVADITSDAVTALADNLELTLDAGTGPFMVVVTANDNTIDLTTGQPPVISQVRTIARDIDTLTAMRFYATPLTTIAVAIASNGRSDAATVLDNLANAQAAAKAFFGFGMAADIDIFSVPPILDENTTSADSQKAVAQYRGAIESLAFIIANEALDFTALTNDAADGILNNADVIAAVQSLNVVDVMSRISVASIAELLDEDATGLVNYPINAAVEDEAPVGVIDSDVDGVNNVDDVNSENPLLAFDPDSDGVDSSGLLDVDQDNCPATANPSQLDTDNDGAGDACDSINDNDTDGDGFDNNVDNCPATANPSQLDTDSDTSGDACDAFPNDADNDIDGDGISGDIDNCPADTNANQLDSNDNGAGDACDSATTNDSDSDGIDNDVDNCPDIANADQLDTDLDNAGDACDADIDGDTLANANDPDPLNSDSIYHFDFFYNQLSSETNAFKAAVVSETVTQSDGTIDIATGVDSTTLDLGSDEAGTGTFDVRATYATTEESVSYTGADFSAPTPLLAYTTVTDDALANTVSLSNGVLSFTDEATAVNLTAWGKHNFIGSGRATLNGVSTVFASSQEQALSVLSFADGDSSNSDLNADYGVVILDTVYGDDEETLEIEALVNLTSVVGLFAADGSGAATLSDGSSYDSGLSTSDGAVSFSTELPENISYSVSLSGAVTVTVDGEPSYGFADSEGDLFTVGDPASRMYGVKLGAGVTNANLAHATFDLQGLVIESSNVTLNATDYVGAVARFNADGTALTLSGTISKAVSAFSDTALPLVTSVTEKINLSSNAITVADNGRLSPITFANSGLELEGFYTANGGLLLRLVNSFAQAGDLDGVGLLAQGSILSLADAPFNGVRPKFCDEIVANVNDCEVYRDIEEGEIIGVLSSEGQIVIGAWSEGVSGSFTTLLRNNENNGQGFADINAAAGNDYEDYYLTQGVLFGTPVDYVTGKIVDSSFLNLPVANAEVTLLFNNTTVKTDSDGHYYIPIREDLPFAQDYLTVSILSDDFRSREINVGLNSENPVQLVANNSYEYFTPAQLDDGLETKALSETDLDIDLINQLMQKVVQQNQSQGYQELHSLLIYKDGALVLEEYNTGNDDFIRFEDNIAIDRSRPDKQWTRTDKHYVASVNKALTSTITGIALDAYDLAVDDKISTLLPDQSSYFADPNKAALSIANMLNMQLGFTWEEWSSNDLSLLWKSTDFTEFLLSRDNAGPGSAWKYNSASPNMLLKGLDNTVDGGIRDWADINFYSKLGITDYDWIAQPDGIPEGGARMHMRPRDMLKVGVTYLNDGVWNGEQVIPAQWVEDVSTVQVADYSYFFWHRTIDGVSYLSAEGDGGQYINIFPEQNMVIVMTQGNYSQFQLYSAQADDIMGTYILPPIAD
ncbi:thrombospondin type 3 repeat-containing protein [Pseudomonadales bacterium]|nr:thrombospondin type 3 repeat-containing protein [Pseudomonadales bacterium]